jgi:hypothetical protein
MVRNLPWAWGRAGPFWRFSPARAFDSACLVMLVTHTASLCAPGSHFRRLVYWLS